MYASRLPAPAAVFGEVSLQGLFHALFMETGGQAADSAIRREMTFGGQSCVDRQNAVALQAKKSRFFRALHPSPQVKHEAASSSLSGLTPEIPVNFADFRKRGPRPEMAF
jgi:hypothetical protein